MMWGAEADTCLRGGGGSPGETRAQPLPLFVLGGQKKVTQRRLEVRESIQKKWGWCWATKAGQDSLGDVDLGRSRHQEP